MKPPIEDNGGTGGEAPRMRNMSCDPIVLQSIERRYFCCDPFVTIICREIFHTQITRLHFHDKYEYLIKIRDCHC